MQTVDDTAIQNQEYVYLGDPRAISPSPGNSRRRSGSMMDLDEAFKTAINLARGAVEVLLLRFPAAQLKTKTSS